MLALLRGVASKGSALGLAALLVSQPAFAGKLADAGKETRSPSSSSRSSSSDSHSSSCCHDNGDAGGAIALYILLSPWLVPNAALEPESRGEPVFEDYPYSRGSNGLLRYREPLRDERIDEASERIEPEPLSGKSVAAQVKAEGGYILGDVYRGALGARLMTPGRLELDATLNGLVEPHAEPGSIDRSTLGNAHLTIRFAQSEHVQFRSGLGYQQYADRDGVEPGIDFLYGFEAELGAHLILGVSGNLGSAGEAFVGQVRASLGVMIDRFEIYAGYDHISIGNVPLGGPAAGVRVWL